jgi:hypothetical protein
MSKTGGENMHYQIQTFILNRYFGVIATYSNYEMVELKLSILKKEYADVYGVRFVVVEI